MKKIIIAIMTFIFLINLTACKSEKPISENTSSLEYDISNDKSCVQITENVYDITNIFELSNNISIVQVDFEYKIILGYDFMEDKYICIPFNSENLKPDILKAIYIPETKAQSGQTVKFNISKDYIVFVKGRAWAPTKTVTAYSLNDGTVINEWEIEQNTKLQINNEKILLIKTSNNIQNIEYIDPNNLEKTEILNWDITQKTQSPILDSIAIGDNGFAFTGAIYPDENSQSTTCFGMIDNNKTTIYLEKKENFRFLEYNSGILVYDNEPVYGSHSSELGQFELYDIKTMKKVIVNPEAKNEVYSRVHISKSGKYIVTGGLLSDEKCIKLYDTVNNKLKAKFYFETTVENPTMEIISISDKENIIIAIIKGTDTTKTYLLKF